MYSAILLSAACAVIVNAANFDVGVGSPPTYTNHSILAAAGDTVTFHFLGNNHTVTQSTFAQPCTPKPDGFSSLFQTSGTYKITVNDTQPIWYYCKQTNPLNHCQIGMVGAVNAPASGDNFDAFQNAAKALATSTPSATSAASTAASSARSSAASTTSGANNNNSPTASGASPSTTANHAAMQAGGSTLGALTAMAFLVGLVL